MENLEINAQEYLVELKESELLEIEGGSRIGFAIGRFLQAYHDMAMSSGDSAFIYMG